MDMFARSKSTNAALEFSPEFCPLVSIVVPIYNTQDYLDECIRSIVEQTYENLQIVLVDDGSTDASLSICRSWAADDGRIIVITKENGGQPSARNAGFAHAKGAWILFVDSDDLLVSDAIESLITTPGLCEMDLIAFDIEPFDETGSLSKECIGLNSFPGQSKGDREYLLNNILDRNLGHHCTYLFSKEILSILDEGNGPFGNCVMLYEDVQFMHSLIPKVNIVGFCDRPLYRYRQREGSMLHSVNFEAAENGMIGLKKLNEQDFGAINAAKKANMLFSLLQGIFDAAGSGSKQSRALRAEVRAFYMQIFEGVNGKGVRPRFHVVYWAFKMHLYGPAIKLYRCTLKRLRASSK